MLGSYSEISHSKNKFLPVCGPLIYLIIVNRFHKYVKSWWNLPAENYVVFVPDFVPALISHQFSRSHHSS